MTTTTDGFVRRGRLLPPATPGGEFEVQPPPEVPRAVPPNLLLRLLPAVMVIAVIGMVVLMFTTGGRSVATNPLFLMFPMMMVMSMVGMFATGGRSGGKRAAELDEDRKDYFRYLAMLREQVGTVAAEQRAALEWNHPGPGRLTPLIGGPRMWERRPDDTDYGHLRLGVGAQAPARRLARPEIGPPEDLEPVSLVALRHFMRTHSAVHRLPIAVSLRGFPFIGVDGTTGEARALIRAMIAELVVFHGPDHLRLILITADPGAEDWDWLKWLPHTAHPERRDGAGAARLVYPSLAAAEEDLGAEISGRAQFSRSAPTVPGRLSLVVIHDAGPVTGEERLYADGGTDGVTVLDLEAGDDGPASRRGLDLLVGDGRVAVRGPGGIEDFAQADRFGVVESEVLARRLARYRPAATLALEGLTASAAITDPGLPALLGIGAAGAFDPATGWRGRSDRARLRVPIGFTPTGAPVELDIKEAAHGGMGPHGLCVGATGSGKSELLRTLVLALMATHSPDELNLVLIDFKGGATFLGLTGPHVAAVITNLAAELTMVDRMRDALAGELNRRQEILREAGNFANVTDYERARANGADLPPMPALFIVVDEFTELLAQKPDLAELFVAIGRLGRSLHIHLLLASQRLEEGRLRGLDSHLSYRIGLKTFSANESRSVLGVPDAYHLPSEPGSAYLKCDSAEPVRFTTSYVSGPYRPVDADRQTPGRSGGTGLRMFTAAPVPLPPEPGPEIGQVGSDAAEPDTGDAGAPTVLETMVSAMSWAGRPAHEVWLPPLPTALPLDAVLAGDRTAPAVIGGLRVPVGLVDRPFDQRREPRVLDLSGAAGNVAIVGAPQTGKSTAVRTLLLAAALAHAPGEISCYVIDFGGGTLTGLAGLPQVGGVAGRGELDAVRRTIAEMTSLMRSREQWFAQAGIESVTDFRRHRGHHPDDRYGDVFLVVDGIAALRAELDETLDEQLTALAAGGLSFGIHLVLTATRWAEIRPGVRDLLGSRLELRLGDALDSELGRRAAAAVPADTPGRGLAPGELQMQLALPRLDGSGEPANLAAAFAAAVASIAARHPDTAAPPVRILPAAVTPESIAEYGTVPTDPSTVLLGVGEAELAPVALDFAASPHFLALGDVASGKTTLLRTLVTGIVAGGGPEQVRVVLIDYRRTLLGVVTGESLAGYASSAQNAAPMMAQLAEYFTARLPPEDVTPAQLRARSWWSGPEVYLVVDDYDMVATANGNPLLPMVELLAQGRDIGLHLVLARGAGGVGRALFDPVISRLRDLAGDVLLLSGDRDEGYIVGRHRMQRLNPGRGELISRRRAPELVQIVDTPDGLETDGAEPAGETP